MGTQTDYFQKIGYKHTYDIGDRLEGVWCGIPWVGSVGNDRFVSEYDGPEITIHLDLPIIYQGERHNILIVKHKDVKRRKEYVYPMDRKRKQK
jgi:hypothetical protein